MQEAYDEMMRTSDEGVEKLIELEVAFLNVSSSRLQLARTRYVTSDCVFYSFPPKGACDA